MNLSLSHSSKKEDLSAYSKAKRDRIVKAALETFLQYGYKGTSMNRVAERAGVIKQTIYSHFNDKEGLFVAIIESLTLEHFRGQFGERIASPEAPETVLRKIAEVFADRQKDKSYIALMRTVVGESSRFPELARLYVNTVIKPGMKILTDYFDAHPELNIKDPEACARIFCGSLVSYIMTQEILYGKEILPFRMERLADNLIELILRRSSKRN
ncbi:MAG: TetR family transcriptional regulator [Candidatus Melainabacteria bacterium]|nr:MAG: TetR family transcriptional regulator [Candidatus Melainabacteria bacterium]